MPWVATLLLAAIPAHADTLVFPAGVHRLAAPIVITADTTISGAGAVLRAAKGERVLEVLPGATATVIGVTMERGFAGEGGCILNDGTLVLDGVTVSKCVGTHAGGGLLNRGTAIVVDSVFIKNRLIPPHLDGPTHGTDFPVYGAGISNAIGATLSLDRVALLRNQAYGGCGGGLSNHGSVEGLNVTISKSRARRGQAGGACNWGYMRLVHSTIARNQGNNTVGGLLNLAGTIELGNSILAENRDGDSRRRSNCAGAGIVSLGGNVSNGNCGAENVGRVDLTSPLGRQTYPLCRLRPGSLGIDVGVPGLCADVDGLGQPRDDGACDAGAFEVQP